MKTYVYNHKLNFIELRFPPCLYNMHYYKEMHVAVRKSPIKISSIGMHVNRISRVHRYIIQFTERQKNFFNYIDYKRLFFFLLEN